MRLPCIVYAIDREHARHITEFYRANGVSCAMIDAKTPSTERLQIVADYRQQKIDVLVNVDYAQFVSANFFEL